MMYGNKMASGGMIHTKFQEDRYRSSKNIKVLSQKYKGLQCWYY
jgi:hypothetical protein